MALSDEVKATIDSMSKAELREEIEKGVRSRFQGVRQDYLRARLADIEEQERNAQRQEDRNHANAELRLAERADRRATWALWISVAAVLVSVAQVIWGK